MRKFATLVALGLTVLTFAQVDPNRTVAIVNGEEIKGGEYYHRMEFLTGVGKLVDGTSFAEFPPGFLTLEQLITEKLVLQLAKQKGVLPTDADIDAEIASATADDPKYLEKWTTQGRTKEELVQQLRVNLAQFRLATRGITITDAEVDQFYNANPTLFTVPKQVDLKILAVNTKELADSADKDLAAGKSFEDVVKAYSLDISKNVGGDFGLRSWEDLSQQARDALVNVKEGGYTDWIVSGETRVRFKLNKVVAPVKKPLDAGLRKFIRHEQMLTKGRIANNLGKEKIGRAHV